MSCVFVVDLDQSKDLHTLAQYAEEMGLDLNRSTLCDLQESRELLAKPDMIDVVVVLGDARAPFWKAMGAEHQPARMSFRGGLTMLLAPNTKECRKDEAALNLLADTLDVAGVLAGHYRRHP